MAEKADGTDWAKSADGTDGAVSADGTERAESADGTNGTNGAGWADRFTGTDGIFGTTCRSIYFNVIISCTTQCTFTHNYFNVLTDHIMIT